MLIKEIEPIKDPGSSLIGNEDAMIVIDEIVELPLRKACKIFNSKGIETIMSSANKSNVLQPGEKTIEKEDVYGTFEKLLEHHNFLEIGKGYAWIMLNFDTLSLENKNMLFDLEENSENGDSIIWFAHPSERYDEVEYALKIGRYNYDYLRQVLSEDDIPYGIEVDETLIEFEKRHMSILYPWDITKDAVFIRMPVTEETTVEEVEEYFSKFAQCFKEQNRESHEEKVTEI